MYVQTAGGASRFTLDSWRVLWRARLVQPLGCGQAPCELRTRPGGPVALLVRDDPPDSACDAAVVVSLEPVRLSCARTVPVVDRFSVWREGAYAIWLSTDGARVLSDRAERGERIWMPRPTPRNRLPPGLVVAPAEVLPAE
jgi:competence protein ComEC